MSEARRIIERACALLIFLIFSLLIDSIKSPSFKEVSFDVDFIEHIQHPLTPSSTEASTTKPK